MNTRSKILLGIAILCGLVGWGIVANLVPRYQGISLTGWLESAGEFPMDSESPEISSAKKAVQAMPVRKVIPVLMDLIQARDSELRPWLEKLGEKVHFRLVPKRTAEDLWGMGCAGFILLGTNGAPAIGLLDRLLDEPTNSVAAAYCLGGIGKPAEASLCRALTNQNGKVRMIAMQNLARISDDPKLFIQRILPQSKDPDQEVRRCAIEMIANQTNAPESAVPLLTAALNDPAEEVCLEAIRGLSRFGTNSCPSTPTLLQLAVSGSAATSGLALRTLVSLDPQLAFGVYEKLLQEHKKINYGALSKLADALPEAALPLYFKNLDSPDTNTALAILNVLCTLPPGNPVVLKGMEKAALNSDTRISLRAKEYLTEQYLIQNPNPFPNEPSCNGRPLGEWLELCRSLFGEPFGPVPKSAILGLGTNAIPFLLERLAYSKPPFGLDAREINVSASCALALFGVEVEPFLPRLQQLMNGTNSTIANFAMLASSGMGTKAIKMYLIGLTNRFPEVRASAATCLAKEGVKEDVQNRAEIAQTLLKHLADPDENARAAAGNALLLIDPKVAKDAGVEWRPVHTTYTHR